MPGVVSRHLAPYGSAALNLLGRPHQHCTHIYIAKGHMLGWWTDFGCQPGARQLARYPRATH